MNMRPWRGRILWGTLALTVVWTAVAGKGSTGLQGQAASPKVLPPPVRAPAPPPVVQRVELERLQASVAAAAPEPVTSHSFGATSWRVAPPPPPPPKAAAKPPPPPPPAAPPVPFTYMGRYEEGGTRIIMLVRGDRVYTVSEGEVIEHTYRVERLADGQLELTYLPLGTRQAISAGGT